MSTVAEILATQQAILDHTLAVQAKMGDVVVRIQALKDQVAAGSVATQADLDQLMAAAQAVQAPLAAVEAQEDTALTP